MAKLQRNTSKTIHLGQDMLYGKDILCFTSQSALFKVLSEVKPLELEGAEAFKQAQHPQTGEFFPSVQGIDKQKVLRMAIEVKDYTTRCWQGTKRLFDLNPIPAQVYIPEFGIL